MCLGVKLTPRFVMLDRIYNHLEDSWACLKITLTVRTGEWRPAHPKWQCVLTGILDSRHGWRHWVAVASTSTLLPSCGHCGQLLQTFDTLTSPLHLEMWDTISPLSHRLLLSKDFYHSSIRESEQVKHSFLFFFFKMDKVFSKQSPTQWLAEAHLYNTFAPIKSHYFLSRSRPGPFNININSANCSHM